MDIVFDVSFDAKATCWHVKKVEDCKRLATDKSHDALIVKGLRKQELRRAGESLNSSALLYKKNIRIVLQKKMV